MLESLAVLLMIAAVPSPAAEVPNLLPNASFEAGPNNVATGWRIDFWQPVGNPRSSGDVSGDVAHSGRRSLHMSGKAAPSHAYWSCRNLPAEPGKRYVFSAWVRPECVMAPHGYCQMHIGFQDAKGEIIQDAEHPFYSGWAWNRFSGHSDWVRVGIQTTSPPGSARLAVTLRLVGVGEAWLDDVELVCSETTPVPQLPRDPAFGGAFTAPAVAWGETQVTLTVENPFDAPLRGLALSASGPGDTQGRSAGAVDIAAGASGAVPLVLNFPRYLATRDARVLVTGRYELQGEARTCRWLIRMPVQPADLLEAIQAQRWGASAEDAPDALPPLELVGLLVSRAGKSHFVPNFNALNLRDADDGIALIIRLVGRGEAIGPLALHWECLDYFARPAQGQVAVSVPVGKSYLLRAPLPQAQVRRILDSARQARGNRMRINCRLMRDGTPLETLTRDITVKPGPEPTPELPALAPTMVHLPVYGQVKLVDEVICGDPSDPHAMRQGAKSLFSKYTGEPLDYYGGRPLLNYDWWLDYRDERDEFTQVQTILGKPCRVADNWGWFAYLMGREAVRPGEHYVLEVEYPEDTSRNFLIWNAIDTRPSFGFHTGSALGDPHSRQRFMQRVDLPLSGEYRRHYSLMTALNTQNWVAIHSMGDKAAPLSEGIAVHALRLYELGKAQKLEALAAPSTEPEGLPRRLIGFISEDATPSAGNIARYQLYGMNMYAPVALSYCGGTYATNSGYIGWPSKLFGPDKLTNPHAVARPGYYRPKPAVLEAILKQAEEPATAVLPVLEYGGTGQLPTEALAVWPDGSPHYYHWGTKTGPDGRRTTRYLQDGTCLDMAHPAVGEDLARLVIELATLYSSTYRSFEGLILTHRFQCWQISYSDYELRRFARDLGLRLPNVRAGQWVFDHHRAAFRQWHYQRKRENLLRATQALRTVRPDLKLVVLNYNAGDDNLHFGTPLYWWDKEKGDELLIPGAVSLPDLSRVNLAELMEDYTRPDIEVLSVGMAPPLYARDEGIYNLAPAHYPFLCGNARFLNHFRTGEGSAVCFWWIYNEDAYLNNPGLGWNCPGLNGNEPAGRYSMMDEVLAMAAGDPVIMGVRIGNMNRGFPDYARRFAAAYRALPALPSRLVQACDSDDIVVRRYDTPKGIYLGVINKGLGPAATQARLRTDLIGGRAIRNLVTGERLAGEDAVSMTLEAMSLTALRVQ